MFQFIRIHRNIVNIMAVTLKIKKRQKDTAYIKSYLHSRGGGGHRNKNVQLKRFAIKQK